uniref:Phytosulfokine n=1 Tax=Lotus japonicus TaxID=34305 RepID=A0A097C2Y4_LOTJA|nr:phytosulfokine-alpha precursor 3 [Lotus japonicus]
MSKLATLFTFSLLLSFTLTFARPTPDLEFKGASSLYEDFAANKEDCEGVEGTEECLQRRTLAAHLDYIYTQKHKPQN